MNSLTNWGQKITRKYSYFYRQNDGLEAKQINPEEKELGLRLKNRSSLYQVWSILIYPT